ncbi:MAG TPA: hypothetical protein VFU74_22760 [Actinocrinis sp.]|nr:hypothetical protein [Actinocrinis sp.]
MEIEEAKLTRPDLVDIHLVVSGVGVFGEPAQVRFLAFAPGATRLAASGLTALTGSDFLHFLRAKLT